MASSSEKHLLPSGLLSSSKVSPNGSKIGFFFGDLGVEFDIIVELVKDEFVSKEFAYSVWSAFRASSMLIASILGGWAREVTVTDSPASAPAAVDSDTDIEGLQV